MRVWIPVDVTRAQDGTVQAFVYERDTAHVKPSVGQVTDYASWASENATAHDYSGHVVWVEANVPLPPKPKMVRVKGKVAKP